MAYQPGPKEIAQRQMREAEFARRQLKNDAGSTIAAPAKQTGAKKATAKKAPAKKKKRT